MAEILIRAIDNPGNDTGVYKMGDPVVAMPDGHSWGKEEDPEPYSAVKIYQEGDKYQLGRQLFEWKNGAPVSLGPCGFYVLKVPGMSVEEATEKFCQPRFMPGPVPEEALEKRRDKKVDFNNVSFDNRGHATVSQLNSDNVIKRKP